MILIPSVEIRPKNYRVCSDGKHNFNIFLLEEPFFNNNDILFFRYQSCPVPGNGVISMKFLMEFQVNRQSL